MKPWWDSRTIAWWRSQSAWSRIQSCGDVFNSRDRRNAVSAVMPRFAEDDLVQPVEGNAQSPRRHDLPSPRGFRYSSSKISPGGIAGPSHPCSLVIVFDADFVGIAVLPPERDPILIVHADPVPPSLIAFQEFEPVAGRYQQIVEGVRPRQAASVCAAHRATARAGFGEQAGVPLTKDVSGGRVCEGLDHSAYYDYAVKES
jgi:hypothetical protein